MHLPPEPPAVVAARNVTGGVEVLWARPATDTLDLGGDAATAYRVYQSEDGLSLGRGRRETDIFLTFLLPGGHHAVLPRRRAQRGRRVLPLGHGGRAGGHGAVRCSSSTRSIGWTRPWTVQEDLSRFGLDSPLRMLLETMNDGSSVRRHGAAVARHEVAFDSATNEAIAAGLVSFSGYQLVDWFTGRGGVGRSGSLPGRAGCAAHLRHRRRTPALLRQQRGLPARRGGRGRSGVPRRDPPRGGRQRLVLAPRGGSSRASGSPPPRASLLDDGTHGGLAVGTARRARPRHGRRLGAALHRHAAVGRIVLGARGPGALPDGAPSRGSSAHCGASTCWAPSWRGRACSPRRPPSRGTIPPAQPRARQPVVRRHGE